MNTSMACVDVARLKKKIKNMQCGVVWTRNFVTAPVRATTSLRIVRVDE
jgi:hypothetical protein